jgi:RNA polymerase sigma-70 factor (ECF subfamily)
VVETGSPSGHPSFEDFFGAEYPKSVKFLMSAGATFAQAEEAVQEAMFQAYRNWARIISPVAWSRKAALHEYYKAIARDKREFELANKPTPAGSVADPTEDTYEAEEVERARQAIRKLPRAQRDVFALTYDGYEPTEIAAILEKPPATVRSNLREARKRLARELAEPPVSKTPGKEGV